MINKMYQPLQQSIRSTIKRCILSSEHQQKKVFVATARSNSRSMTVLSKQSAEEYKKQNYTERMSRTGRPVSPHVAIYSFPITALTSITNRVTGVALSFGCAGLGAVELINGDGSAMTLMSDIASMGPIIATTAKFTVSFPLVYHYLGGLRHLVWDKKPELLNTVSVEQASYVLAGSSIVTSLGIATLF